MKQVGQKPQRQRKKSGAALVLIVEDFEDARDMLVQLLAFHGFRTATAGDGLEAIEQAQKLRPAVILMDLSLPRLDGWEAIRRLKADPGTKGIPVICVTGHGLPENERQAREAGCGSFLVKPVALQKLMAEIGRVLGAA